MDSLDLIIDCKDYYVPLTKKEIIEKLEYYKTLTLSFDRKNSLRNLEYYELIDSLINLEISAFDINFASYTTVPNILRDVLKYNVWHLTKKTIEKFNSKEIVLIKENSLPGTVKVYDSNIVNLSLKPAYAFSLPSININCYETNYEYAKEKYIELIHKEEMLNNKLNKYNVEQLIELGDNDSRIEEYFALQQNLEEIKKELKKYRKNLCLYKESIYKEVAYALLDEYHLPNEIGKIYKKNLPWITFTKKSL